MTAKATPQLRYAVYLENPDQAGESVRFLPGEEIPDWARKQITNPNAWEGGKAPAGAAEPDDGSPPRAGKGSGRDEWVAYAKDAGVEVADDATRDEIIAAVDAK